MKKEEILHLIENLKVGETTRVSENLEDANTVIEMAISINLQHTPESGIVLMPRIKKEGIVIECMEAGF